MSHIVLHVDGSTCRMNDGSKRTAVGWGLVAHFGGERHERTGAVEHPHMNGSHELLALVEGIRFAHGSGFEPGQVALYTDDIVLGNAGWLLHPGNGKWKKAEALVAQLRFLTRQVFDDGVHETALRYLREARLHWVKGHNFCVDQERADYLARHAAWTALGQHQEPLLPLEQWMEAGLPFYEADHVRRVWYAPFIGSPAPAAAG